MTPKILWGTFFIDIYIIIYITRINKFKITQIVAYTFQKMHINLAYLKLLIVPGILTPFVTKLVAKYDGFSQKTMFLDATHPDFHLGPVSYLSPLFILTSFME